MLSIVPKSELQNVNLTPVRQVYKIYIGSLYIQYLYIYIFIYLISIFINVYFYTFQAITMLPGVVCHLSKQNHCQSLWSHTRQVLAKFKQESQDGAPPPPLLALEKAQRVGKNSHVIVDQCSKTLLPGLYNYKRNSIGRCCYNNLGYRNMREAAGKVLQKGCWNENGVFLKFRSLYFD